MLTPAGKTDKAFAWIEKIENGILVHYQVAVKHRMKNPSILSTFPDADGSDRDIMEVVTIGTKTVYCMDLEEVYGTLKKAGAAEEELAKLERDGKVGSAFMPGN